MSNKYCSKCDNELIGKNPTLKTLLRCFPPRNRGSRELVSYKIFTFLGAMNPGRSQFQLPYFSYESFMT